MNEVVSFPITRIEESKLSTIDFNNLRFGRDFSDHMFIANYYDGKWQGAEILPYQDIPFSPAACVFHYGQAILKV